MIALGIAVLGAYVTVALCAGPYENCDYYQAMEVGKTYYVYSPKYPGKYPAGTSCRWYAKSPPGSRIELRCDDMAIPPSSDCRLDRLSISRTGRLDLADAVNYCGKGSMSVRSADNVVNIVLQTAAFSPGGSVLCKIEAKSPDDNCDCGWKNQERIVGGRETGVNEYPMMAGLVDGDLRTLFCGAVILSEKFALTAAHCLISKKPNKIALLVGDHDLAVGSDTDSARLHIVDKFIVHQDYGSNRHLNDIALVRVKHKMEFTRRVGPVCLPFFNAGESFVGETVTALGWGTLEFGGNNSQKLMKVPLDVISNRECRSTYGDLITDNQICTYKENQDACQSDSGGPLLWRDRESGRMKLVGIVSYGIMCATPNPSVNTRITNYIDWIQSNSGEKYCIR